ncbi:sigma-70 family RNA polymerase sigma factor [Paenibacillus sp. JNUCC31]|uniref:RNA polymerase sigma factor n=1 Tax=Paenibacillus sp. JNUCC-31 TaxID=2777983 RepID=UPI00177F749E|nr:sigma-70 family RNA polymerase sigma factor [Paenibacillus sp. JNUCC-31]QOS77057.1 sigma-70 family RNA polymerase sigma factor [Paenibacillus sp. JNUCC-31]
MTREKWFYLLRRPMEELENDQHEEIYQSYYKFIYGNLYSLLGDHALTEDLIHESFLKIIVKGPDLQSEQNIPAWIRKVAYNTTIDFLRKKTKENQTLKALIPLYECDTHRTNNVESELELKWRNEKLYQAIGELKLNHQIMLKMFYVEGKTCKEIGESISLTEATISKRLSRVRKYLRELIINQ